MKVIALVVLMAVAISADGPTHRYLAPQQNYLPPNQAAARPAQSGYNYNQPQQQSQGEPANYDFKYDVQDAPSGNDFGHMESRRGDKATGRYYVQLPDGRRQVVTYEADQTGYHPTITYEDTGRGSNAGYNKNAQSGGFGGY